MEPGFPIIPLLLWRTGAHNHRWTVHGTGSRTHTAPLSQIPEADQYVCTHVRTHTSHSALETCTRAEHARLSELFLESLFSLPTGGFQRSSSREAAGIVQIWCEQCPREPRALLCGCSAVHLATRPWRLRGTLRGRIKGLFSWLLLAK